MSKHVQHEDLNRKQKERVLSIFLKFCIILILLGGAIVYSGYILNLDFNATCNLVWGVIGIVIILIGILGLLMYNHTISDLKQNPEDQWYDSANNALSILLYVFNNVAILSLVANLFYQKMAFDLVQYKFSAELGSGELEQKLKTYQFYLTLCLICSGVAALLMAYISYVCHCLFKNNQRNTRKIIYYYGILFTLLILGTMYYLESIGYLISQDYFPSSSIQQSVIYGLQIVSVCYIIGIILAYTMNILKNRNYYVNVSIFFIFVCTVMVVFNGQLYRSVIPVSEQYNNQKSCKQYIRWVSEDDLKTVGCSQKYTQFVGPKSQTVLTCSQSDQIFTNLEEQKKYGVQACLQKDCCGVLNILFTQQIAEIASLYVIIAGGSLLFIHSSYFLTNKYIQKKSPNTSEYAYCLLLLVILGTGSYFLFAQNQKLHSLNTDNKDIQDKTLFIEEQHHKQHNFQENGINHNHHFKRQLLEENDDIFLENQQIKKTNNNKEDSHLTNCQYVSAILGTEYPVNINENSCISNLCDKDGLRIGFRAFGGILSYDLEAVNNNELLIFDNRVYPYMFQKEQLVDSEQENQFLAVQGSVDIINEFISKQLQFCQNQPFQQGLKYEINQIDLELTQNQLEPEIIDIQEPENKQKVQYQSQQEIQDEEDSVYVYAVQINLFDVSKSRQFEGKNVEIQVYQDIIDCYSTQIQTPLYKLKYDHFTKQDSVKLFNLPLGYYTAKIHADNYNHFCVNLHLNQENQDQEQKTAYLSKSNEYRAILEWDNSKVPLELFVQSSKACYASLIDPSCEGMQFSDYQDQGIKTMQSIKFDSIEKNTNYLLFVNQYIDSETKQKLEKLQKETQKPFEFSFSSLETNARIHYYIPQSTYPYKFLRIPQVKEQILNTLTFETVVSRINGKSEMKQEQQLTWLVFCLENEVKKHQQQQQQQQEQLSILEIQDFWTQYQDIEYLQRKASELYPDNSICNAIKEWNQ